jgi:hypothetical protein
LAGDVAVDDIRISPITANVLADFVNHQHIDPLAWQAGESVAGDLEQLLFTFPDAVVGNRFNQAEMTVPVFD